MIWGWGRADVKKDKWQSRPWQLATRTTLSLHQAGSLGRKWCEPIIKLMEPTSLGGGFSQVSAELSGGSLKIPKHEETRQGHRGLLCIECSQLVIFGGHHLSGECCNGRCFFFNLLFFSWCNQGDVYQPSWKEITANTRFRFTLPLFCFEISKWCQWISQYLLSIRHLGPFLGDQPGNFTPLWGGF